MANKIQLKRSSTTTSVPTISDIAVAELALNYTDKIMFSSDGSAVFEIGANLNVQRIRSTLIVGNSTVNLVANSTWLEIANSTVNTHITIPTGGQYSATNYFLHANGEWVQINLAAGSPGGSNTHVQFNDSTNFGGSAGFTFDKTTNIAIVANTFKVGANVIANTDTLLISNATHFSAMNASFIVLSGGGATAIMAPSNFAVGANVNVTTGGLAAGANVSVNELGLNIGNTTANLAANSTALYIANSSSNATMTPTGMTLIGGSVTTSMSYLGFSVGGNVNISVSNVTLGNSTVNSHANSTSLVLANSTTTTVHRSNASFYGTGTTNTIIGAGVVVVNSASVLTSLSPGVVGVGLNVELSSTRLFIGGTGGTSNITCNNSLITIANATANHILTATTWSVGNSTANHMANSTTLKIANSTSNQTLTPLTTYTGNSTFYVQSNSTAMEVIGVGYTQVFTGLVGMYDGTYTGTLTPARMHAGNSTINCVMTPTDFQRNGVSIVPLGQQAIWVPAVSMIPRTTNGPATDTFETATNRVMMKTLAFDSTVNEHAQFWVQMPKSWDEGTIIYQAIWSQSNTTTNFGVAWALSAVAFADDDAADTAFGTEVIVTDTGGTNNDIYITAESAAVTVAGSPGNEEFVCFQVKRLPANASDTMTVDARLHGIKIHYTTNAATDD